MVEGESTLRTQAHERSRRRFLDAGVEVVGEQLRSPIDHVKARDVVDQTDYTTGAFYHHWATQEAYRLDLRQHIGGLWEARRDVVAFETEIATTELAAPTLYRTMFRRNIAHLTGEPGWWVEVAILAASDPADQRPALERMNAWIDSLTDFYQGILDGHGLRCREGFSTRWITISLMALVDGFTLQMRSGALDLTAPTETWTGPELAVAAIVTAAVEPPGDAEPVHTGRVEDAWDRLFSPS